MLPRAGALRERKRATLSDTALDEAITARRHKPDHWLMVLCAILLAVGLVVIYAISPALSITTGTNGSYFVERQALAVGLSIIAFFVTANIPTERWRKSYKLLIGAGILATLVAIALPVNPNYPAHRWVRLGSLSFESVELVIFSLLIWMAHFLTTKIKRNQITNVRLTAVPMIIAILIIGVVVAFIQSDLGSTAVIIAMMGIMAFVAGLPVKRILIIGCIILLGTTLAIAAFPYRRARLEAFLHPTSNCQGSDYQACQALIAVGSGGFSGLGFGSSVQAYGYLPEADNDSIFAIYAEKFGFVGSIALLAVFGYLFYRINRVATNAPDDFSRLIVVGVLTWISVQTMINIGAMVGLLPLKGITLPFVSYGGTSIIFFAGAIGLVYQVSRYTYFVNRGVRNQFNGRNGSDDDSSHRRGVGRAYHPDLSGRIDG